jgi:hypothetical protein
LLVDPECGARGVIRDTGAVGLTRFLWSVVPSGRTHPIAEGRTGEIARARTVVETVLRSYAADFRALAGGPFLLIDEGADAAAASADRPDAQAGTRKSGRNKRRTESNAAPVMTIGRYGDSGPLRDSAVIMAGTVRSAPA